MTQSLHHHHFSLSSDSLDSSTSTTSKKEAQLERDRILQWTDMLKNWSKIVNTKKFQQSVGKGIPHSLKGEVWKRLLELNDFHRETVYDKMLRVGRLSSEYVHQINLDCERTFRDNIMFKDRRSIK